jgi:antitoxin component of RelBE/YafQ-DinJ toxin-antitoxin module
MKQIIIKVPDELKLEVIAMCTKHGFNLSALIRNFLIKLLKEKK